MTKRLVLVNALPWGAAILAASLMHAPSRLWLLVLPCLAVAASLANGRASAGEQVRAC